VAYQLNALEPGVLMQEKGNVVSIQYTKQFIIEININQLKENVTKLEENFENFKKDCNCEWSNYFKGLVEELAYDIETIKDEFEEINWQINVRNKRSSIITFLQWITGVMSSFHKQELENKIIELRNSNIEQFEKMNHNIKILTKSLNKKTSNENSDIDTLGETKKNVDEKIGRYRGSDNIVAIAVKNDYIKLLESRLRIEIKRIRKVIKNINEAINDAHNKIFTSKIYNLRHIIEILKGISLPAGKKWIIDPNKPDLQILKYITRIYTVKDEKYLYFILQIPTVNEEFSLSEVIDIPKVANGIAYFVESTTNYVMTDKEKTRYTEISRTDLNKCKKLGMTYFCLDINVFNLEHENCVGKIIDQDKLGIKNYCSEKLIKLDSNSMLIQKIDKNAVMFINTNDKLAKLLIDNEIKKIKIPKVGMIKLESKKEIKIITENHEIILTNEDISNITKIVEFSSVLEELSYDDRKSVTEEIEEIKEIIEISKEQLYAKAKGISEIEINIKQRNEMNNNNNNIIMIVMSTVVTLSMALNISTIILVINKMRKGSRKGVFGEGVDVYAQIQKPPEPKPRTSEFKRTVSWPKINIKEENESKI